MVVFRFVSQYLYASRQDSRVSYLDTCFHRVELVYPSAICKIEKNLSPTDRLIDKSKWITFAKYSNFNTCFG